MLQQMRENTKTILWIVVVTFVVSIFAVWGMNLKSDDKRQQPELNIVGIVNGIEMPRIAYSNKYQELYSQIRMQRGDNFSMSVTERHMLLEQAWEASIQEILLNGEIRKLDINITDEELVSFLRRNPHPQLMQVFVDDDGKFVYQEYLKALSDPKADWTELEKWGQQELPMMRLTTYLKSQIHVPERKILERFKERTQEVTVKYVSIPHITEAPPYNPSEDEIMAHYEKDREKYTEFEMRRVSLIKIAKEPTELDEQDVKEQLEEIRKEILDGDDFAESARIHSDDYITADKGGDLGFFGRSTLDSTFTETAFALAVGEISKPVRTVFGYHLIKTEEKNTKDGEEQVRASHILMKVEPGYETMDSLSTLLRNLNESIRDKGFEDGASKMGLEIVETEPFFRGSFIKDHGYLPRIVNFAFNHKTGSISSDMHTETSVNYVKVIQEIPEKTLPLDQVRDRIIEQIRYNRKIENSKRVAETIRQEAMTSGNLEAVAHSRGLEFKETAPFKIDDSVPGIGTGTNFSAACYMLPLDRFSVPVQGNDSWYVIVVVSRSAVDMIEFNKQRPSIINELLQEASSQFLAGWYQELRETADIIDMREITLN